MRRRRTQVEMLRSLPTRAYVTVAALRNREEGQALVEYAILILLISLAAFTVLTALGHTVSGLYNKALAGF
jgi:Flp pilus assembly pilin Flp